MKLSRSRINWRFLSTVQVCQKYSWVNVLSYFSLPMDGSLHYYLITFLPSLLKLSSIRHLCTLNTLKSRPKSGSSKCAVIMSNLSSGINIDCIQFGVLSQQDSAEAWQIVKIADRDTQPRYASLVSRQVMSCTDSGHTQFNITRH